MPVVNKVSVRRQVQALELAVDTSQQAGPPYLVWGDNVTLALNRLQEPATFVLGRATDVGAASGILGWWQECGLVPLLARAYNMAVQDLVTIVNSAPDLDPDSQPSTSQPNSSNRMQGPVKPSRLQPGQQQQPLQPIGQCLLDYNEALAAPEVARAMSCVLKVMSEVQSTLTMLLLLQPIIHKVPDAAAAWHAMILEVWQSTIPINMYEAVAFSARILRLPPQLLHACRSPAGGAAPLLQLWHGLWSAVAGQAIVLHGTCLQLDPAAAASSASWAISTGMMRLGSVGNSEQKGINGLPDSGSDGSSSGVASTAAGGGSGRKKGTGAAQQRALLASRYGLPSTASSRAAPLSKQVAGKVALPSSATALPAVELSDPPQPRNEKIEQAQLALPYKREPTWAPTLMYCVRRSHVCEGLCDVVMSVSREGMAASPVAQRLVACTSRHLLRAIAVLAGQLKMADLAKAADAQEQLATAHQKQEALAAAKVAQMEAAAAADEADARNAGYPGHMHGTEDGVQKADTAAAPQVPNGNEPAFLPPLALSALQVLRASAVKYFLAERLAASLNQLSAAAGQAPESFGLFLLDSVPALPWPAFDVTTLRELSRGLNVYAAAKGAAFGEGELAMEQLQGFVCVVAPLWQGVLAGHALGRQLQPSALTLLMARSSVVLSVALVGPTGLPRSAPGKLAAQEVAEALAVCLSNMLLAHAQCGPEDSDSLKGTILGALSAAAAATQQAMQHEQDVPTAQGGLLSKQLAARLAALTGPEPCTSSPPDTVSAPANAAGGSSGQNSSPPLAHMLPSLCVQFLEHNVLPPNTCIDPEQSEELGEEGNPVDPAEAVHELEDLIDEHEEPTAQLLELLLRLTGQQQVLALAPLLAQAARYAAEIASGPLAEDSQATQGSNGSSNAGALRHRNVDQPDTQLHSRQQRAGLGSRASNGSVPANARHVANGRRKSSDSGGVGAFLPRRNTAGDWLMPQTAVTLPSEHVDNVSRLTELILRLCINTPSPAALLKPLSVCFATMRKLLLICTRQLQELAQAQLGLQKQQQAYIALSASSPRASHTGMQASPSLQARNHDLHSSGSRPLHRSSSTQLPLPSPSALQEQLQGQVQGQQVAAALQPVAAVLAVLVALPGRLLSALQARLASMAADGGAERIGMQMGHMQGLASLALQQLAPTAWRACYSLFLAEASFLATHSMRLQRSCAPGLTPVQEDGDGKALGAPNIKDTQAPSKPNKALAAAVSGFWQAMPILAATLHSSPNWAATFFTPGAGVTPQQHAANLAAAIAAVRRVQQQQAGGAEERSQQEGPGGGGSGVGKASLSGSSGDGADCTWDSVLELMEAVQGLGQAWQELSLESGTRRNGKLSREQILAVLNETNMGMSAASKGYALVSKYEHEVASLSAHASAQHEHCDEDGQQAVQAGKRGRAFGVPAWAGDKGLLLLRRLQGGASANDSSAFNGKKHGGFGPSLGGAVQMGICANPDCISLAGPSDGLTPLTHVCQRCLRAAYCSHACMGEHRHEHRAQCKAQMQ